MPLIKRLTSTISIHAPRTGSDAKVVGGHAERFGISIHAPRTGSDAQQAMQKTGEEISIHAPRTGSDSPLQFAR